MVAADAGFCLDCWRALHFLGPPACARCDRPFATAQGDGALCAACIANPPAWDAVHAALAYGAIPRQVVLRLKYGGRVGLARLAARLMAARLARDCGPGAAAVASADRPLLVPVPLHRWRLWSRGFNQSAEIARHIAATEGLDWLPDALLRRKRTPPLRGLGRAARARAVRGAFALTDAGRAAVQGRRILLVDDVLTSGATADACTRVLRRAGAHSVELLVFARVLDGEGGAIDTAMTATDMG